MQMIKLNEATVARRRIPVVLVDDTDGKTPETGVTLSAGDMKISKNGAAEANHAGTLTEVATGDYYYEPSAGEADTPGYLTGKIVKNGVRTFRFAVQIVAFDPYDATRMGMTAPIPDGHLTSAKFGSLTAPTAAPSATPTLFDAVAWLFTLGRNKITQTATTQALRNDGDSADIATSTVSDDGTTFTRGKYS